MGSNTKVVIGDWLRRARLRLGCGLWNCGIKIRENIRDLCAIRGKK